MFARVRACAKMTAGEVNEIHKKILKTRQFPGS